MQHASRHPLREDYSGLELAANKAHAAFICGSQVRAGRRLWTEVERLTADERMPKYGCQGPRNSQEAHVELIFLLF